MLACVALHAAVTVAARSSGAVTVRGEGVVAAFRDRSAVALLTTPNLRALAPSLIVGHLRALFTMPGLVLMAVGLFAVRRAARPGAAAVLLLAGCAHTLVFVEGAARHEFWVTTPAPAALPLAAWGLVCLVRSWVRPRWRLRACASVAVGLGAFGAVSTLQRQDAPLRGRQYFFTLGEVIRTHTESGDVVATSAHPSEPLRYYARRKIVGNVTDAAIPAEGLPSDPRPVTVVALPAVPFGSDERSCARLRALLRLRHYPRQEVQTETCGVVELYRVAR
ncbi:MAG: hypothetical protein H6837_01830 [Planctomycetes bacterium]|nr:hypothetical protein [Planctomycetota bacterium]